MKAFSEYARTEFDFRGHAATLVKPDVPCEDGRWAIYTEYFGAFPGVAEALLERGWHIAGLRNIHRWGCVQDQENRLAFLDAMEKEYGLSHRVAIIGMSCGGLHGIHFAAYRPERISAMYLDAPVVNLLSCPLAYGRKAERNEDMVRECLAALGKTESEMLSYRENPLDVMHIPAEAKIPLVLVYGDADPVVPYSENGALLEKLYRECGAPLECYGKHGCAHHPHGLPDSKPIADFLEKYR